MIEELKHISQMISDFGSYLEHIIPTQQDMDRLHGLEERRKEILHIHDVTWHLKRRATWLWDGDKNTKFFHKYASHQKNCNIIGQIKTSEGKIKNNTRDIQREAVRFFEHFY